MRYVEVAGTPYEPASRTPSDEAITGRLPALDVGIFVHDRGAQVAAVEYHDVCGPGLRIEVHERRDQDAEEQAEVSPPAPEYILMM